MSIVKSFEVERGIVGSFLRKGASTLASGVSTTSVSPRSRR